MEIFTPELASRECVEVLVASSSIHEKVSVVKTWADMKQVAIWSTRLS